MRVSESLMGVVKVAPMSASGGKAVVFEKVRFRLQLARSRSSTASKSGPLKGRNRPKSAIQARWRERPLLDRKAAVHLLRSVKPLIAEGVEKVPKLKVFETMIQNPGLC